MGACHTQKHRRESAEWKFYDRHASQRMDFTCQRLSLYLELVGDTHSLGGYLQEKIKELVEIKQQMMVVTYSKRMLLLHDAAEIIEYLYNDKHFSQAFPILRESLHEITQLTLITE